MKNNSHFLMLSLAIVFYFSMANAQTSNIYIGNTDQTVKGFGGMNFPRWIPDLTADQVDKAFGTAYGQIGLSILRISVAPDQNQWNLEVPTAQRAVSYGAIVFATPWSPPASMKTNGSVVHGELRTDKYEAYAGHLRDFYSYMSTNGVNLYAISVQNEPDWLPGYESCAWSPSQIRTFLDNNASVIPTQVIAPETIKYKAGYMNETASSSQVDILANHGYDGSPIRYSSSKEQWMTEHYGPNSDENSANNWPEALEAGKEIHDYLINGYSAYVWWYIRRGYGLITEDGNVSKRGFVMSHFSKYIRPGYLRTMADASPASGLSVSAYQNGNSIVVVAINQNSSPENLTLNFNSSNVSNITKYETTGATGQNQVNAGTYSGGSSLTNTLAGNSISTFVGTIERYSGENTDVWLEAECGVVGSLWNVSSDGNASSGEYVTIQSGNNSTGSAPVNSSGQISYTFNVAESGTYDLWSRVVTPNGSDDSFWLSMDGGTWYKWNNIGPNNNWTWEQVKSFNLSEGEHTLKVSYREDGAKLDKILITNTGLTPYNEGSAAKNCMPFNQPPIANAGQDQILTDSDNTGSQSVTLNGSESNDPDGIIVSYLWTEGGNQLATGAKPTFCLSPGTHNITLTVTDNNGKTSSDNVIVDVNEGALGYTGVWLEAECGTVGSLWNIEKDGIASNSQYVAVQPGNNSLGSVPAGSNGQLSYTFNLSESGAFTLWARVIAPSSADDSYWVQIDNGPWLSWNNIESSTTWTWDDVTTYTLSAGSHTLTIAYREDGALLDKLYITNSGEVPVGMGEESNDCTESGDYLISVKALGADGSEQITLNVGGEAVQTWTVSTSMDNYTATTSLSGIISVEFINDDGSVRDVQIDYIEVDGSVWQAEDQAVNTGVWQDGSCGGSYSEWLHCGGYIEFSSFKNSRDDIGHKTNTDLLILPNPVADELNIVIPDFRDGIVRLRIYTVMGTLVKEENLYGKMAQIRVADLMPGQYFIEATVNNKSFIERIVKN